MKAWLDRVRAGSHQLHYHHSHSIHVADRRPGAVPLHRRLSSTQPSTTTHESHTHTSRRRSSRRHLDCTLFAQLRPVQTSVARWSARVLDRLQRTCSSCSQSQSLTVLYYNVALTKARFPLPEFTARVHGPSWRPVNSGAFFDTRQSTPELTARVDGCQKMHQSWRAVNSGRELE